MRCRRRRNIIIYGISRKFLTGEQRANEGGKKVKRAKEKCS
jgi:hypothetical protein